MLALILFILILSVLVLIHEFGHFYAAKKMGVRVEEFGFGLPPRVISKKYGDTLYSLNLLPFGGFVKLTGEDIEEEGEDPTKAYKDPKNFASKTPLQRALIIVSGVLMNLFLAVFLYSVFLFMSGYKSFNIPLFYDYNFRFGQKEQTNTVVMGVEEDSPAEIAEIEPGEAILEIAGAPVYNLSDVKRELSGRSGEEVSILLMDVRSFDKDLRTVSTTVDSDENGEGIIGVYVGSSVTLGYWHRKPLAGLMHSYNMIGYSAHTFSKLVKDSFATRDITPVSSTVAGPVGIFSIVGIILNQSKHPFLGMLDLIALLSMTLAIINILPFPALDGGRLFFIVVELVTKRKVNPKIEVAVHKLGMVFLLAAIALVTLRDITRII